MKHRLQIVLSVVALLGLAATAWAGGDHCGMASETASGQQCTIGPNQMVYSFSVPGAECEACQNAIQRTAMAQKGVTCAHVDLASRTAYLVADKNLNRKAVAKAISEAGFKNSFRASGTKAKSELLKVVSTGQAGACCAKKDKDKV